jgi:preprotein translocase subunit SecY
MWIGEQITERGVGNGMSLLIFAGIVSRLPQEFFSMKNLWDAGTVSLFGLIFFLVLMIALTTFTTVIQQANRKIPVQYAQRIIGRKVYGGQSTYLPLKVDHSGVIAVIFASSVLYIPSLVAKMAQGAVSVLYVKNALGLVVDWFSPGTFLYNTTYALLIVFFCYFYTAIIFNPVDVSENIKKYGGFIPGIRPGQPTAQYIDHTLVRITLGGALAVALIAILPDYFANRMSLSWYFGGTTLLIVVGVALDTMKQVESHLLMRHYEGFMRSGKLKSRTSF